jgi:TRAP-type C4-dicarboxylate transport system permease small subunit
VHALKNGLDTFLKWASVILFALLVVIVVWQVFTRQVMHSPATWTDEAARYTFVWLGFFATALVFSERGHIAVDFLVRLLPEGIQRAIAVLVQLCIIAFAGIMLVWGGWRAAQGAWNQNLSSLPLSVGEMYLVMPVTGVLIVVYALYHVVAVLNRTEAAVVVDENPDVI